MSNLRDALEAALDDDPGDRAARMALADHLAEQGDPRGEFMQVQLALEDGSLPPERRRELAGRENTLLRAHSGEWLGGFAAFMDADKAHANWEGGDLVRLDLNRLSFEAAAALAACPAARRLRSLGVDRPEYYSPEWSDPHEVPDGYPEDEEVSSVVPLADAPFARTLEQLRVGRSVVYDEETHNSRGQCAFGVEDVAEKLPRLESLAVFAKGVDLRALFRLRLPHLRTLTVYHGDELHHLSLLAANDGMPALEELRVHPAHQYDHSVVPRAEVAALLNSPHFPKLRELHLHGSDLGDEGCADIVASGILKRLRVLDLRFGCVTDAGARALLASPDLAALDRLDLSYNELTGVGVALIRACGVRRAHADYQYDEIGEGMYLYSGDIE